MTLPTFLVIGAAKSGTTSLHHYLDQHPDVFMSPLKEPGFFAFEEQDVDFNGPGDDWIRQTVTPTLSSYSSNFEGIKTESQIGESSPVYLYSPQAPRRIKHHIPDARLIAILRNPVDRAFSQFSFFVQCGREPLRDFATALKEEERRIEANWAWGWHYSRAGYYHEQLERYLEFFDRSTIKVLLYEDLRDHPAATMCEIFGFLSIDDRFEPDFSERLNVTKPPRSKFIEGILRKPNPARTFLKAVTTTDLRRRIGASGALDSFRTDRLKLSPETARLLGDRYREDVSRLQDLIQRDLSSWLE